LRFKKTIIFSFIILVIFLTYVFFHDTKLNYVVIGDSLAAGQNPYGEKSGYGYADYIRDYLEENGRLKQYVKGFAVSGYTTDDVLADLSTNKKLLQDGHEVNLRQLLRESDIVTVSVGANDFMRGLSIDNLNLNDSKAYIEKIDGIMDNVKKTLVELRKYAKNQIIVIGYYNPFPLLYRSYESALDEIFEYADQEYEGLCALYDVEYVSVYHLFKENSDFLPNPFDIHPNLQGYKAIANSVIDKFLKE